MKTSLLLLLILVLLSCEKEIKESTRYNEFLSQEKTTFLQTLRQEAELKLKLKNTTAPNNENNYMDYYGAYVHNMIMDIKQSGLTLNGPEDLRAACANYADENPFWSNMNINSSEFDDPFLQEILTIVKEFGLASQDESPSISALKSIETLVAESNLLEQSKKAYLLACASSLKFARSSQSDLEEIIHNFDEPGNRRPPGQSYWDCVENTFALYYGSSIADFENHPTASFWNLINPHTTIPTCFADALWSCR